MYGGLKRLHQWNGASVDVVDADDVGDVSPTFAAWSNSLHVSMTRGDTAMNVLPLWHGSVTIHGSEVDAAM